MKLCVENGRDASTDLQDVFWGCCLKPLNFGDSVIAAWTIY